MIAHFHGLAFKVISPSAFLLKSVPDELQGSDVRVIVAYNGERWYIHYDSPTVPSAHAVRSRDEAMRVLAMVAERTA